MKTGHIIKLITVAISFAVQVALISTGTAQTTPVFAKNIEQVRYADQFLVGSDIGLAIHNAFADCGNLCQVLIPSKSTPYAMTTPVVLTPGETLCGYGSANTTLNYSGGGSAITIEPGGTVPATANQVKLCGLTLLGNNNATAGINIHDVVGTILDDLDVSGFYGNGSSGIWINNQSAWTERTSMVHVALGKDSGGNAIGIRFSVNSPGTTSPSFSFSRFLDLRINLEANQTGIQIENGSQFTNSTLIATFNIDAAGATAIKVLSGGYAQANDLRVFGESGVSATGVSVASGGTFGGQGYVLINGTSNTLSGTYQVGSESIYNSAGQFQLGARHVIGYSLSAGTSSVTLPSTAAFTNSGSYVCTFSYNGSGVGSAIPISYQIISGNQFNVTGQPYIGINYVCVGN
jgi:hypothetical protein